MHILPTLHSQTPQTPIKSTHARDPQCGASVWRSDEAAYLWKLGSLGGLVPQRGAADHLEGLREKVVGPKAEEPKKAGEDVKDDECE